MKIKKNLTFDDSVLKEIQDFADCNGISLSGAISVLCMQALQASNSLKAIDKMQDILKKLDSK